MDNTSPIFKARVAGAENIAPDIRILRLDIADRARFDFKPGQYLHLCAAGQDERAFSIASPPEDPMVELHIRGAGHGISQHAMTLGAGDALDVKGPFGTNILREGARPLLVLAGGIGIAPMKSIVKSKLKSAVSAPLLKGAVSAPVYLYWGVRDRSQLYLDALFRDLAARHAHFTYVPLPQDEKGFIGAALEAGFEDLSAFSVYLAGPKPMIDATTPVLLAKNAPREHIFSDAFSA